MGHYDNLYDQTAQDNYDQEVKQHKESISNSIDKMDIYELKLLADIADNISDYQTFFTVLKKNIK